MSEQTFQLLRGAAFAVALGLGLLLERAAPHARLRPAWRANLSLWALNAGVVGIVCGGCACTVARWASQSGFGLLNVLAAPPLVEILATILVLDAVSYAWHRANHRIPFLWRFHRVHHRDGGFNVSTALRFHPGEVLLSLPLRLAAVVALGAPVWGVLAFEAVFMCANILEHGNFDVPRRLEHALSALFVMPALHRWHHSREPSELNTNFGTISTLWDRALGTFQSADSRAQITTGLPGIERDWRSLQVALVEPFRSSNQRPAATDPR